MFGCRTWAKYLKSIPGSAIYALLRFLAIIVDVKRFPSLGHLLSYGGLIKHEKLSGGRSYGKRKVG
ncbi:MAG: hypothetical protein A4S09_10310 [Proteobacteria bacterium SG_bin7]|nr:MAG: hypothetical protein A4S09_10310 [Proteobacteria bacterium SG_bin7]